MSDQFFSDARKQKKITRHPPVMRFWGRIAATTTLCAIPIYLVARFGSTLSATLLAAGFLLLALLYQLRSLFRLTTWLLDPHPETVPDSVGNWGEVFATLYRQEKKRRSDQSRMNATLTRFTRAAQALPDGVVVLSESDRIEWCNKIAEQHLGLNRSHDLGLTITYLIRQPHFVDYVNAERYMESIKLRPVHDPERLLSIQIFPFETTHKLLLTRDITQLEKVGVVHRDFVANVSHELRTPLTVIGGFLETLLDLETPNPQAERRYMGMMLDQTRRMQRLVDELLTLSKLEDPNGQRAETPIDIPSLVQMLAQEATSLSNGQHDIKVELDSDSWLTGNSDELHSALGNLVSNAVRYTPAGGCVTLRWSMMQGLPAFSVADSGIGIAPEDVPRLTERFYRVDRSRSRETGGTGLGLAIVKHVLLRHQARLDVQSELGVGSTFSAVFPEERAVTQEKAATSS